MDEGVGLFVEFSAVFRQDLDIDIEATPFLTAFHRHALSFDAVSLDPGVHLDGDTLACGLQRKLSLRVAAISSS